MYNPNGPLERAMDAVIGHEVRKLNNHLPKKRLTLNELLKSDHPTVETIDGSSIIINKAELQELANIVPAEYHDRMKLPIIILRRMELGRAVHTVAGERIEEFTVKKILGLTSDGYHQMYKETEPTFLYRPQVVELLRRFHSLIVLGFGIPKELSDYAPSRD